MRLRLVIVLVCALAATAAEAAVDRPAVDRLLSSWLEAQNTGDFDAYAALYASRFYGVRRTGAVTRRFDRDGWLKDRKRMFRKKMTVQADDVRASLTAGSARVSFSQTWASGRYKDVGGKQLVLVAQDGAWKIAREEMLASRVIATGEAAGGGPIDPETFSFVLDVGRPVLFLRRGKPIRCRPGTRKLVDRGVLVTCDPVAADVRTEERAIVGKRLRLFTSEGDRTGGTVTALQAVVRYEPHFGTIQRWEGEMDDAPRRTDAQIAEEVWTHANADDVYLVGVLKLDRRTKTPLWAQAEDKPLPDLLGRPVAAEGQLRVAALQAFGKLKGYRENQAYFREEVGGRRGARWDTYEGAAPKVALFQPSKAGRRYLAVSAAAGPGCGGFHGEFWALFEVQGSLDHPKLRLLTDPADPGPFFRPLSAVDLDGDGIPEFLNRKLLVRPQGEVHKATQDVGENSYDCPC